jgi:proteasome lid subunit RPN8/RPN11
MLRMSQSEFEAIRRHGERTYPHECCGVLIGRMEGDTRTVELTVACANTRSDRAADRFNIAPEDLIRAQRDARARGLDIIGFYHSHPDCPAQWSKTDLEEAHWLGCSYVITSVMQGKADRTNSFALRGATEEEKRFDDERIEVTPATAVAMARAVPEGTQPK